MRHDPLSRIELLWGIPEAEERLLDNVHIDLEQSFYGTVAKDFIRIRLLFRSTPEGHDRTVVNLKGDPMRKLILLLAVVALAVLPAATATAQTSDGQVIVVHGVPDLDVDVYVNGDLTLSDFRFGDVTGPLDLPAGSYDVEIYGAGVDPATNDPALAGSADLAAGAAVTIAAYLQEGGAPTLGVFVENNSTIQAGNARVTARHLADFGAVDVLADGGSVFSGVTNGQGGDADVPAGTYGIQITAAGDPGTVAFDADVALAEGENTIAYAIGSVAGGSFQVVTAALTGLAEPPSGVPTGTGGLSVPAGPWAFIVLAGLALAALGGGAYALAAPGTRDRSA